MKMMKLTIYKRRGSVANTIEKRMIMCLLVLKRDTNG
jgi:hypothetical protein